MPPLAFLIERIERAMIDERMNCPALPEAKPEWNPEERRREAEEIIQRAKLRRFPTVMAGPLAPVRQEEALRKLRRQAEALKNPTRPES
jgi:hypothetical protein